MMQELDAESTIGELKKAFNCLSSGKAPGKDGIPTEIVKLYPGSLLTELRAIPCLCWREDQGPQDMGDSNIVTLYKNKGDRSDCSNYRAISLFSIVGKLFEHVSLKRLQVIAELKSLSRVSIRIQSQQIKNRYGLLHQTAPRETQRATKAPLHCLHRSNQGF